MRAPQLSQSFRGPVVISGAVHLTAAGVFALMMALGRGAPEKVDVEIIESPKLAATAMDLSEQPKPQPRREEPARKVFGVTKSAVTSDEPGPGVSVKQGNTLAAAPDTEKLRDTDASALPIPTDEYLVSKMPIVASAFTIPYPPEAKAAKIEGKVVIEILIDATGTVRDARLISGPGHGLDEAALKAIYQFKFRPAEVDGKPVAVKIPFTYNFLLKTE